MDQRLDDAARALGEALALTATRTSPMKRVRDLYRGLALGVVDDDAVVDIEGLLADTNIPLHASLTDPPPRLPRVPRAADIRAVVTRTLVAAPRHVPPESTRAAVRGSEASLTRREIEIAGLIAAGLSNRDIAEKLFLSVRTVESHIYQARSKVGALSRGELGEHVGAASASR
ncbi:helix-turn-helix transcriptional regulator [Microbacterium sp. SSW1-59]|uniref:helix-turn-helix transcriptional regulator n=1 Tax=Microbacterium xanthum TaxID=3079794 RepID=UPI002AD24831|nr:helix-turn-helix transcriptional regulator [Microbacterium sp. SSW1-59]MDZ8201278.1 helix-turn-helix transcriptional regulator [Microbacterium sp. SSW1-59]